MDYFMKKMHYGLFVVALSLPFSVNLLNAAGISQEEIESLELKIHGIALFSGADPLSAAIKVATKSPFSHVGIMLHDANKSIADLTSWYCFESTGSAGEVLSGDFPHVRLTPWIDVIENYPGGVSSRLFNTSDHQPDSLIVTQFVRENNEKSYELSLSELLKSLQDKNKKPDMETVFCSELAADLMQKVGIINSEIPSNNYVPSEFSVDKEDLPFINGYSLGQEIVEKTYQLKRITRAGIWFHRNVVDRLFSCIRRQGDSA